MTDRDIARRVVWFQEPELTLANPRMFLSYLMTYGTLDEVQHIRARLGDDLFRKTLENPVIGVFDARSWNYWHLFYGKQNVPPLPSRRL